MLVCRPSGTERLGDGGIVQVRRMGRDEMEVESCLCKNIVGTVE